MLIKTIAIGWQVINIGMAVLVIFGVRNEIVLGLLMGYLMYHAKEEIMDILNWKLERVNWFSKGKCWKWRKITRLDTYSGNQITYIWGRIAVVFERREWIHPVQHEVDNKTSV